jgi:hypothetical protein
VSGLLFGLAVLVRPESLVYLPVLAVVAHGPVRDRLRTMAAASVVALLVCVPWVVRNQMQVGPVGLSSVGGVNFYLAHGTDGYGFVHYDRTPLGGLDEVAMSERGYELGLEHLREQPSRLLGDVVTGTRRLYGLPRYAPFFSTRDFAERAPYPLGVSPQLVGAARVYNNVGWMSVAVLAVLGTGLLVRRRHQAALVVLGVVAANWFCFTVVFWALPRYRFTVEPFLCIAAAVAVDALIALRARPAPRRRPDPGTAAS